MPMHFTCEEPFEEEGYGDKLHIVFYAIKKIE